MASSSQITYSYSDLIEKAEAQIKTRPGLWGDLIDDLWIWKKTTDWLEVSCFFLFSISVKYSSDVCVAIVGR